MSKKKSLTLEPLLLAAPDSDGNMKWFTEFDACDPFVSFGCKDKRYAITHGLEYGRMQKESCLDGVFEWSALVKELDEGKKSKGKKKKKKGKKKKAPALADLLKHLQKKLGIDGFEVPRNFPALPLYDLLDAGIHVEVVEGAFFPERAIKTRTEVRKLKEANDAAAAGHAAVRKTLRAATIGRDGVLKLKGKVLTAEMMRHIVNVACLEKGGVNNLACIVAPGDQATDCHCKGYGPIKANELIVVDIFPRIADTGFYGDMTRTYLKGKASPEQRKLYNTVKKAHAMAIAEVKDGVDCRHPWKVACKYFEEQGYETTAEDGTFTGFFHGLGHGVGYDIHEAPNLGRRKGQTLAAGHVVTIEPGLYYPGLGGVRVEDVVHVTKRGCTLISSAPYSFQIA